MRIDRTELKKFVEDNPNLVSRKESKKHPGLFVLKYCNNVFYDNLWHKDEILTYCRGLVVDADYNIVVAPFQKVFNYKENNIIIDLNEKCVVTRKVNGFLGCVTYDSATDQIIYSTTGSLDSNFVGLIRKHIEGFIEKNIKENTKKYYGKATWMFEICDESDPHIIPEKYGAYLIGVNIHAKDGSFVALEEITLDFLAPFMACRRFRSYIVQTFQEVLDKTNNCEHEGYMVKGMVSGTKLKLKSPYYLITKFLGRASDQKLLNVLTDTQLMRKKVDEEYYPLLDEIRNRQVEFMSLDEQGKIAFIREFLSKKNE